MKVKVLLAFLLTISLSSCKNEDKKTEGSEKASIVTITVNAVVKQDDDFQIFFKENNDIATPFDELQSVWRGVKGMDTAQDIVFDLPEGTAPTMLRFDLGINKNQPAIQINTLKITYAGKSIDVSATNFTKYFFPDEKFVKIEPTSGVITPILSGDYYDPMVFSTELLNAELSKLMQ